MPDCEDLTGIYKNPHCNEEELACHEAQAPDASSNRVSQPLSMGPACKGLLLVPQNGFDISVHGVRWLHYKPAFIILNSSQILIESTVPWMPSDARETI